MTKIIRSQDNMQLHFVSTQSPCCFNIANVGIPSEKEDTCTTLYSVGINNVSLGQFKVIEDAIAALTSLEDFLASEEVKFKLPSNV